MARNLCSSRMTLLDFIDRGALRLLSTVKATGLAAEDLMAAKNVCPGWSA